MSTFASDKMPIHLKWSEYRTEVEWNVSPKDKAGLHLGEFPGVETVGLRGHIILLPTGLADRDEVATADLILIGVQGETKISVGAHVYLLNRYDVLRIKVGSGYQCSNIGMQDAMLFVLSGDLAMTEDSSDVGDIELKPAMNTRSDELAAYLPWKEHRRKFRLSAPHAETAGLHRAAGPWVQSSALAGHMMLHPFGQSSPWHSVPHDLIFIQIRGDVNFAAADQNWTLKALDLLMMPANVPYSYTNVGEDDALFFDTFKKVSIDAKNIYYASDPGWPVRTDAELLDFDRDFNFNPDN